MTRSVIVTGAAGSLGEVLTKILVERGDNVVAFDQDETRLFYLKKRFPTITSVLGKVENRYDLHRAFMEAESLVNEPYAVPYVIHAAAYKHLGMSNANIMATVQTNIYGTMNVVDEAKECGVDHLIFISSDKAVEPIEIYGSSKLIAERIVLQNDFGVFRCGNFSSSRGSVTEVWRGVKGPIPITHPAMARWFIDIEVAAKLICDNLDSVGPEVMVPRAEEGFAQMKINDLANSLYPDRGVKIIGFDPREEKLVHDIMFDSEWKAREHPHLSQVRNGVDHIAWVDVYKATKGAAYNVLEAVN